MNQTSRTNSTSTLKRLIAGLQARVQLTNLAGLDFPFSSATVLFSNHPTSHEFRMTIGREGAVRMCQARSAGSLKWSSDQGVPGPPFFLPLTDNKNFGVYTKAEKKRNRSFQGPGNFDILSGCWSTVKDVANPEKNAFWVRTMLDSWASIASIASIASNPRTRIPLSEFLQMLRSGAVTASRPSLGAFFLVAPIRGRGERVLSLEPSCFFFAQFGEEGRGCLLFFWLRLGKYLVWSVLRLILRNTTRKVSCIPPFWRLGRKTRGNQHDIYPPVHTYMEPGGMVPFERKCSSAPWAGG